MAVAAALQPRSLATPGESLHCQAKAAAGACDASVPHRNIQVPVANRAVNLSGWQSAACDHTGGQSPCQGTGLFTDFSPAQLPAAKAPAAPASTPAQAPVPAAAQAPVPAAETQPAPSVQAAPRWGQGLVCVLIALHSTDGRFDTWPAAASEVVSGVTSAQREGDGRFDRFSTQGACTPLSAAVLCRQLLTVSMASKLSTSRCVGTSSHGGMIDSLRQGAISA